MPTTSTLSKRISSGSENVQQSTLGGGDERRKTDCRSMASKLRTLNGDRVRPQLIFSLQSGLSPVGLMDMTTARHEKVFTSHDTDAELCVPPPLHWDVTQREHAALTKLARPRFVAPPRIIERPHAGVSISAGDLVAPRLADSTSRRSIVRDRITEPAARVNELDVSAGKVRIPPHRNLLVKLAQTGLTVDVPTIIAEDNCVTSTARFR